MGWTYSYLLWGIRWATVQKMLADAPSYNYDKEPPTSPKGPTTPKPKPKPSNALFLYRDQHDEKVKEFVQKHSKQ